MVTILAKISLVKVVEKIVFLADLHNIDIARLMDDLIEKFKNRLPYYTSK